MIGTVESDSKLFPIGMITKILRESRNYARTVIIYSTEITKEDFEQLNYYNILKV